MSQRYRYVRGKYRSDKGLYAIDKRHRFRCGDPSCGVPQVAWDIPVNLCEDCQVHFCCSHSSTVPLYGCTPNGTYFLIRDQEICEPCLDERSNSD